ncbi:MAG: hypothetical protein IJ092_10600 [Atopobiaceae bacterium]|nr:hypothetical protein [Atopobiaceae bacterium]
MSKEAAERFVKAWEAKDPEVARALEAQDKTDLDVQALAEIACGIGFEVSEQELAEQFELRRSRILSKIDAADVSDDDLEQVAGGRNLAQPWPRPCSSDYDPNSRCAFDDRCLTAIHWYPANRRCAFTFEPDEHCFSDDNCSEHSHCYNPMYGGIL